VIAPFAGAHLSQAARAVSGNRGQLESVDALLGEADPSRPGPVTPGPVSTSAIQLRTSASSALSYSERAVVLLYRNIFSVPRIFGDTMADSVWCFVKVRGPLRSGQADGQVD